MRTRQLLTHWALLGAALLLALPATAAAQYTNGVNVVATNNAFLDAHVYAVQGGRVQSLGMVTGLSTTTLKLPKTMVQWGDDVQLLVYPIGSPESYLSSPIPIYRGNELTLTIQDDLNLSSVSVRPNQPNKT